jgi:hypothetical protein
MAMEEQRMGGVGKAELESKMKQVIMSVKPENMEPVKCKRCRGEFFQQVIAVRRISPIVSPTGKEEFISMPILICVNCKEMLQPSQVGGQGPDQEKPPEETQPPAEKKE